MIVEELLNLSKQAKDPGRVVIDIQEACRAFLDEHPPDPDVAGDLDRELGPGSEPEIPGDRDAEGMGDTILRLQKELAEKTETLEEVSRELADLRSAVDGGAAAARDPAGEPNVSVEGADTEELERREAERESGDAS